VLSNIDLAVMIIKMHLHQVICHFCSLLSTKGNLNKKNRVILSSNINIQIVPVLQGRKVVNMERGYDE